MKRSNTPKWFTINQALYTPEGRALGRVVAIEMDYGGVIGYERAKLRTDRDSVIYVGSEAMRSEKVLTRAQVRAKNIPRTALKDTPLTNVNIPPTTTLVFCTGMRLFESAFIKGRAPLLKGIAQRIKYAGGADYAYATTDLGQPVSTFQLQSGSSTVGQRRHPRLITQYES